MHFLFISSILGPTTGGIETLIVRMSKWFLKNGHRVTFLSNTSSKFRELFPDEMKIVDLGDQLHQFRFHHKAKRAWPNLQIERPDVIKSFHLRDSWISSVLSSIIKPAPKVLFGNYFPYIFPQSRNPFSHFTNRPYLLNLGRNFSDNSILCMDEEQIIQFCRQYGNHRNPTFWPLPIENPSKPGTARTPKPYHIVSVARLESMKAFIVFSMIDVVAKLRQKGYPVTWTVYGEGSLEGKMKAKINALGLNEAIDMKGELLYSQFAEAMQTAYLFVGGGTAVVEAALCGVPGVLSFAFDRTGASYGSLYHYPFGNLGLRTDKAPGTTVEAEIERIFKLRNHEYEEEIKKNREYAQAYTMDISMNKFLEIVANASISKTSFELYYYYYFHRMIELIWQNVKLSSKKSR